MATLIDFYNDSSVSNFYKNCCRLISQFEGFCSKVYNDPGGVPTIGFGTTNFSPSIVSIDQYDAIQLVLRDVKLFHSDLLDYFKKYNITLTDAEVTALISFCYNLGFANFKKSTLATFLPIYSMCCKTFNRDHSASISIRKEIYNQFLRWTYCKGKQLPGLVTRRKKEANIFLNDKIF